MDIILTRNDLLPESRNKDIKELSLFKDVNPWLITQETINRAKLIILVSTEGTKVFKSKYEGVKGGECFNKKNDSNISISKILKYNP